MQILCDDIFKTVTTINGIPARLSKISFEKSYSLLITVNEEGPAEEVHRDSSQWKKWIEIQLRK